MVSGGYPRREVKFIAAVRPVKTTSANLSNDTHVNRMFEFVW